MKSYFSIIVLFILVSFPYLLASQSYSNLFNATPEVQWDGQNLTMTYNGHVMLQGRLENPESLEYFNVLEDSSGSALNQVVQMVSGKEDLLLTYTVYGSPESFPCEAERREDGPTYGAAQRWAKP